MPRTMQEVHALGLHAQEPRPKCPDCQVEKKTLEAAEAEALEAAEARAADWEEMIPLCDCGEPTCRGCSNVADLDGGLL
jgi:hypothetical protein